MGAKPSVYFGVVVKQALVSREAGHVSARSCTQLLLLITAITAKTPVYGSAHRLPRHRWWCTEELGEALVRCVSLMAQIISRNLFLRMYMCRVQQLRFEITWIKTANAECLQYSIHRLSKEGLRLLVLHFNIFASAKNRSDCFQACKPRCHFEILCNASWGQGFLLVPLLVAGDRNTVLMITQSHMNMSPMQSGSV